jgi:hypothetical protein
MLSLYKVKNMQAIINVDSRTRSHGTDSAFSIDLRESLNLGDHQVRVDNCQFSNSFYTTDLGANLYYKNGATIQSYTIPERAYTGTSLAAAMQTATGRSTSYDPDTNALTQTITATEEWLSDVAIKAYSTGFPAGASSTDPRSLNGVLGDSTSVTGNLVFSFVKMSPYDYLFLRSRRLTVENSHDPNGRHDVLLRIPLVKGIGSTELASTPEGVYMKLSRDMTLRNIDFELTDYRGNVVDLRGRPMSFELCFD